jgi:hypothetical protein
MHRDPAAFRSYALIQHRTLVEGGRHGRVPARRDGPTPHFGGVSLAPHGRSMLPSDPTSR